MTNPQPNPTVEPAGEREGVPIEWNDPNGNCIRLYLKALGPGDPTWTGIGPAAEWHLIACLLAPNNADLRMRVMLAMPDKMLAVEERRQREAAEARAVAAEAELATLSRIIRRTLACGQLEKLEDAKPHLSAEPQGTPVEDKHNAGAVGHGGAGGGDEDGYDMTGASGPTTHRDVRNFLRVHTGLGETATRTLLRYIDKQDELSDRFDVLRREHEETMSYRQLAEQDRDNWKALAEGRLTERDELAAVLRKRCPSCEGIDRCYPDCAFTTKSPAPSVPDAGTDHAAVKPLEAGHACQAPDNLGAGGSGEAWVPKVGQRIQDKKTGCFGRIVAIRPEGDPRYPLAVDWEPYGNFQHPDDVMPLAFEPANPQPPKLLGPVDGLRAELVAGMRSAARAANTASPEEVLLVLADRLERGAKP